MRIDFLLELVHRRVSDRYIGSSSRLVWVVVSPILPLLINIAVFYFIARIPQVQSMGLAAYAAFMFSGLLPFRIVQKAAMEGCDLLVSNMEMLKSAVFPLPYLSFSAVGALSIEFGVQCVFMAVLLVLAGTTVSFAILLLPVVTIAFFVLALGLSWMFSIVGFALREIQEIVSVVFSVLLYATPIVYPPEAAPHLLGIVIRLNPLSSYITAFRDSILPGPNGLHWVAWGVVCVTSTVIFGLGLLAIHRAQRFVGDMV